MNKKIFFIIILIAVIAMPFVALGDTSITVTTGQAGSVVWPTSPFGFQSPNGSYYTLTTILEVILNALWIIFTALAVIMFEFRMASRWYTGSALISSYRIDELLGTKLRALYQRKKGRDLFDLWQTAKTLVVNPETVVSCFLQYMEYEEHQISRAEFEMNLFEKLDDSRFLDDISPLLTTGSSWDSRAAARYVLDSLVPS